MSKKHIPSTAITIRCYEELFTFAKGFAEGKYNLLAVVGSAGLSKSQAFAAAMRDLDHCLIKGHATPFVLYKTLFDHLNEPVVIDDADTLYETKAAQPLLKCLCDTTDEKHIAWHSKSMDDAEYPRNFTTKSKTAILCNEWKTVSHNMRAVTDRGIFLNFVPTVLEVHRQVEAGGWLRDDEVYAFIGSHLHLVTTPSMRYYAKARELKAAGLANWQDLTLNMLNPDLDNKAVASVSKLMADDTLSETQKVSIFERQTKMSRATFFRYKKILADAR